VQRLVKTWESLSHQDIITSQSVEELIDPSRNMRKYRKSLANAKPPVVPFFGKPMFIYFIRKNLT
jgi:hypothetical protein